VPGLLATGCLDRADPGEGGAGPQPCGVVACGDEERGRGVRPDAGHYEEGGVRLGGELLDLVSRSRAGSSRRPSHCRARARIAVLVVQATFPMLPEAGRPLPSGPT